ncbi:MAG: hypothetical protein JNG88_02005 [Phycisphaerales bacterium]|nr:hypothetical protein [Phycisphaerales bacterium]
MTKRMKSRLALLWMSLGAGAALFADSPRHGASAVYGSERPRIAVVGFSPAPETDARDVWIATAAESALERGLQRAGPWVVVPTERLVLGHRELGESSKSAVEWKSVADLCGAECLLIGTATQRAGAFVIELNLLDLKRPELAPTGRVIEAPSLFGALEAAYGAAGELLRDRVAESIALSPFQTPARSPSALEYHARALSAFRAADYANCAYYARQAIEYDALFRPAGRLLAEVELRGAPDARATGRLRLTRIGELAKAAGDTFDTIEIQLRQALICRTAGAFDAAQIRIETALGTAYDAADPIWQATAFGHMADLHLAQAPASGDGGANAARVAQQFRRAAAWQQLALEASLETNDRLGRVPLFHRLAMLHDRLGAYDDANRLLSECAELTRRLGLTRSEATTLLLTAQVFQHEKRWADAESAGRRCLPLVSGADAAAARVAIAMACREQGKRDDALREFEAAYEALRIAENLGDQLLCLREIAVLRRDVGNPAGAAQALREAIDLAHAMKLPIEATLKTQLDEWSAGSNPARK